jgi:hypothetical protein
MGATTLLPSYVVDVWVSGSDASGNPFETLNNNVAEPFASWPLALLGPSVSFDNDDTSIKWSNPSPVQGSSSELEISVANEGGKGELSFILQRLVEGGNWNAESNTTIPVAAGLSASVSLPVIAEVGPGESQEYRLLVTVDGVEMDRMTVDPLIIKKETVRDGDALAEQAGDSQFAIFMYIVAIVSLSAFLWMLVMYRKMKYGDEELESDQTDVVVEEMEMKIVPQIAIPPVPQPIPQPLQQTTVPVSTPTPAPASQSGGDDRGIAPIPPTGLPSGWTQEQWNHFGWQYIDSLKQ